MVSTDTLHYILGTTQRLAYQDLFFLLQRPMLTLSNRSVTCPNEATIAEQQTKVIQVIW